ncbi:uncharacterized protein LOC9657485 [Selaginella moellendorffii]|uniref:uncharacterized protein LOC9657485 n=1 Tax=Selaginella moellendorffii TaxID=88036 RepID=UPI000D1C89FA|nr:uncharacterized protein LOC9657485 [Selaginella moellendorffii]|eukprot:XP_024517717.1 uncharacterized protein LOC9657485 [Selaginella moellendorffii]
MALKSPSASLAAAICVEISQLLGENECAAFSLDDQNITVVFEGSKHKKFASRLGRERVKLEHQQMMLELDGEEVSSGLLLQEAVRHSLVSSLVRKGWTFLRGGSLVFGTIQEGLPLETVSVDVHLESNGHIVLLLSPDVTSIHFAKIVEGMPEAYKKRFEQEEFVSIEEYCLQDDERTINEFECCVLPYMRNGYAVGLCKTMRGLNDDDDMELRKQLWKKQNGLQFTGDCYYVKICFSLDSGEFSWFPSSLVMKKSGFFPVVPSLRCSLMLRVLQHFFSDAAAWDFFCSGRIDFKELEIDSNSSLPWTRAASLPDTPRISLNGMKTASISALQPDNLLKSLRARVTTEVGKPAAKVSQASCETARPVTRTLLVPNLKRGHSTVNKAQTETKKESSMKNRPLDFKAPANVQDSQTDSQQAATKKRTTEATFSRIKPAENTKKVHAAAVEKKKKPENETNDALVTKKNAEGKLKDLSVAEMKNFLRSRKAKLSGKKEELIARIQEVLG